jgi:hypothetical protein
VWRATGPRPAGIQASGHSGSRMRGGVHVALRRPSTPRQPGASASAAPGSNVVGLRAIPARADPDRDVRVGRRWHAGPARFAPEVTPDAALKRIVDQNPATRRNAQTIRKVQTDMRVIRIDLDREQLRFDAVLQLGSSRSAPQPLSRESRRTRRDPPHTAFTTRAARITPRRMFRNPLSLAARARRGGAS